MNIKAGLVINDEIPSSCLASFFILHPLCPSFTRSPSFLTLKDLSLYRLSIDN